MRLAFLLACSALAVPAFAADRTFDIVSLKTPKGFDVVEKPDGGGRLEITKWAPDNWCSVVVYASAPAGASLEASFAAEWQAVAVRSIAPVPAPAVSTQTIGNTRAAVGSADSKNNGGYPTWLRQIVLDGGDRIMTILV